MSDAHTPGDSEDPIPRDREDQQAAEGEDPLAIPVTRDPGEEELPDTDVSGSGPKGHPESGTVNPEHPTPDEPAD
ncbi:MULTISPECIES: hypothetical protein [unclassified Streptomyces]|uniref:hypothetical protein n=1 Tax=unclassified Streptomyces TaxID=2593676 RepID=UPI0035D6E8F6